MAGADNLVNSGTLMLSRGRAGDGAVRLILSGELDIYTAPRLREAIEAILTEPMVTGLMVDVARLDYVDCAGISALIAGRRLARQHDNCFAVVNAGGLVRRVLTVLCLDEVLGPVRVADGPT